MTAKRFAIVFVFASLGVAAWANSTFVVEDIQLKGLMRVPAGTVFNEIPLDVGDEVDPYSVREIIRLLYKTKLFEDIQVAREGTVLVITLSERPAIDSIEIEGNKAIETEALLEGLAAQGLKEGEIFQQATLEGVRMELHRQYVGNGQYASTVETEISTLPRNRVSIKIVIDEGRRSSIRQVMITGNDVFDINTLRDELELSTPTLLGIFKGSHKYSREKLQGDLESLESFYRNRGYVQFEVRSTQVAVDPSRQQVYLTIDISEGKEYTVRDVAIIGKFGDIDPALLEALLTVQEGQVYSGANVTQTEDRLTLALGNSGYTFAAASGVPEINDDGTVDVKFVVDTGSRTYVRRVNFAGNIATQDHVLRREMRQIEGGWASTSLIELSKTRLQRLGHFSEVTTETIPVIGSDDQVDVNVTVSEQPTGTISLSLGYSELAGLTIGTQYSQNNVAGSGNSLSFDVRWGDYYKTAVYQFTNPYFTPDGISRGIAVHVRESNYSQSRVLSYSSNSQGAEMNFGFPIGETRRLRFASRYEETQITDNRIATPDVLDFVTSRGTDFANMKFEGLFASNTLNRLPFATRGQRHILTAESTVPGSDLEFYKVIYGSEMYFPLWRRWLLGTRVKLGYGDTFDEEEPYPFFENFYAGGFTSVRGYEKFSLGPRVASPVGATGSSTRRASLGGNSLVELSTEFIFPLPFVENPNQFRSVVFLDGGNVFQSNCPPTIVNCSEFDIGELRYAAGISVSWLSQLGILSFSVSQPFNHNEHDITEEFAFEIGGTY